MASDWQPHVSFLDVETGIVAGFLSVRGRECEITMEPRPDYCDRGNFLAKLFPEGELARSIDGQDGWPRYYFDLERAKLEIEAWLRKRGQWMDQPATPPAEGAADDRH